MHTLQFTLSGQISSTYRRSHHPPLRPKVIWAFEAVAPNLWGALPAPLCSVDSVVSFEKQLKTHSTCLVRRLYNLSKYCVSCLHFQLFVASVATSFCDFCLWKSKYTNIFFILFYFFFIFTYLFDGRQTYCSSEGYAFTTALVQSYSNNLRVIFWSLPL